MAETPALASPPGVVALPRRRAGARRLKLSVLIPAVILTVLVLCAAFAPLLAPYGPREGSLGASLRPPAWLPGGDSSHWLGTDRQGRDVLSRLIYGARISLSVSLLGILIGAAVGTLLGLVAGYTGGWIETLIMRLVELTLSLPLILIALVLVVLLGPGLLNIVIVISVLLWARFARQVRGEVLALKQLDYVALARVAGLSDWQIMRQHILPGTINTLVVLGSLQLAAMIILESSLSFLGVGLPPDEAAWGVMINEGLTQLLIGQWWVSVFPGIAISLSVLSVNLLGDWLRDALDPRLRNL